MDSIIRELTGIDRAAQDRIEAAKRQREDAEAELAAAKTKLLTELTAERERKLAEFIASAEAERDRQIAALDTDLQTDLQQLHAGFETHRKEWEAELFARVLQ